LGVAIAILPDRFGGVAGLGAADVGIAADHNPEPDI